MKYRPSLIVISLFFNNDRIQLYSKLSPFEKRRLFA